MRSTSADGNRGQQVARNYRRTWHSSNCVAGRIEEALKEARNALELDLDFRSRHTALAEIYRRERKYSEAIVESKTAAQLSSNNPNSLADVGLTYAASGGRTHALEILRELHALSLPVCPFLPARGRVLWFRAGRARHLPHSTQHTRNVLPGWAIVALLRK